MKGFLTRKQLWRRTTNHNFYENKEKVHKNMQDKCVHFNSLVSVILIPERKEYPMFLGEQLWYSQDDYFGFIKDRDNELFKSKYHFFLKKN